MSASISSDIELTLTPAAAVEVKKFMEAEGVSGEQGGLRVAVHRGAQHALVHADDEVAFPRPRDGHEDEDDRQTVAEQESLHTFWLTVRPRMPVGRKISSTSSSEKAIMSR